MSDQQQVPPRLNLYRASAAGPSLSLDESSEQRGGMPTMTVDVAVFNQWAEIRSMREGHFLERFSPRSLRKTISENGDRMKVMFQHGKDPQIGQKLLGVPSNIREDGDIRGLADVPLFDTTYNRDLLPGLRAGAYGASMQFAVMREDFNRNPGASDHNPDGIPERTVLEARIEEFGPVVWPAYLGATSGVRSITDEMLDIDAVLLATPILLDDDRLQHARAFISRGIPPEEKEAVVPDQSEVVRDLRDRTAVIRASMAPMADMPASMGPASEMPDDVEPATVLDGDTVEALGSLIEVIESATEAMESLLGIDDDTMPDEDDPAAMSAAGRSATVDTQDAPPVDDAEPSVAHLIRGRRDKTSLFTSRKEQPSWQLPSRSASRAPRKSTLG